MQTLSVVERVRSSKSFTRTVLAFASPLWLWRGLTGKKKNERLGSGLEKALKEIETHDLLSEDLEFQLK